MTGQTRIEYIVAEPLALSLHWDSGTLTGLHIRWAASVTESAQFSTQARQLKAALARYVNGQAPDWPELPLDFSRMTEFQRAVLERLARVPYGTVCTYGELAASVGNPKGARAIGRVMATNPYPLIYPCHRVVGSTGKLTGFSAEDGIKLKAFLLQHEGAL